MLKYIKLFWQHFNFIHAIFGYPKLDLKLIEGGYDDYWARRQQDKNKYRFSLNMKWWEKLFSLRYRKSMIVSSFIEEGSRVLDVGCGEGMVLKFLRAQKNIKGVGVDISPKAIEQVKADGFEGVVGDVTSGILEGMAKSDYILLLDIIEHLYDSEKLLLYLKSQANKGILVHIPNTGHYIYRLRLLFGRTPSQWLYFPNEHIRFWTVRDFHWWAQGLGFRVVKHKSSYGTFLLKDIFPNIFSSAHVYYLVPVRG